MRFASAIEQPAAAKISATNRSSAAAGMTTGALFMRGSLCETVEIRRRFYPGCAPGLGITGLECSTLGGASGQAGNIVVHQEGVDDERRRGAEQCARHDLPPVEHIAFDEGGDDTDRQ